MQMARIMALNPETAGLASAHEVVAWAMRDVGDYFSSVDPEAGRKININFNWNNTGGQVLALRAAIARLDELAAQPLPFIYMHLMNLTSWVRYET